VFVSINGADLQAVVTALQAQVASLTADYNKLATRWNKRYDLKKAPKHKVVLK
jgi:cell division protein FtsB